MRPNRRHFLHSTLAAGVLGLATRPSWARHKFDDDEDSKVIVAFVGGRPGGRRAPDLASVPIDDDCLFYFALAFARDKDRDGRFVPAWDEAITPDLIHKLKEGNDKRQFLVSLAGDGFPWQKPADPAAWSQNATKTLIELIDRYELDGIDLNYESGLDDSFADSVGTVIANVKKERDDIVACITPFGATWDRYLAMWKKYGMAQDESTLDWINYQSYGDDLDVNGYLQQYERLAKVVGGYDQLTLGIATSQTMPRGLQPPQIFDVMQKLKDRGLLGVMTWSLEDSAMHDPAYTIESKAQKIFGS